MEEQKKHRISPEALIEWKKKCAADKCSDTHRQQLVHGSFIAWRKYSNPERKWADPNQKRSKKKTDDKTQDKTQDKAENPKRVLFSCMKDFCKMYQEGSMEVVDKNGIKKSIPYTPPGAEHPFHAIEAILYGKEKKPGQIFKNFLLQRFNEKFATDGQCKTIAWMINYLFENTLFRKFIQENAVNESLLSIDEEDGPQYEDENAEIPDKVCSSDKEYLQEQLEKILDSFSEKHKCAAYYRIRKFHEGEKYELPLDDIYQVTGVKKTFYDYPNQLFKEVQKSSLINKDFTLWEITLKLQELILAWAETSELCQAMDAKVAERNEKKQKILKNSPENGENVTLLSGEQPEGGKNEIQ